MRIADTLLLKDRAAALGEAETIRDNARRRGNIGRADLFVAVCSVITWRDTVTGRPRATAGER